MIEARFTTDAFPWPPWSIRAVFEGRTPKIAFKRRCAVWSVQCIIVRLSSFDGELSVFVDCKKGESSLIL